MLVEESLCQVRYARRVAEAVVGAAALTWDHVGVRSSRNDETIQTKC